LPIGGQKNYEEILLFQEKDLVGNSSLRSIQYSFLYRLSLNRTDKYLEFRIVPYDIEYIPSEVWLNSTGKNIHSYTQ